MMSISEIILAVGMVLEALAVAIVLCMAIMTLFGKAKGLRKWIP